MSSYKFVNIDSVIQIESWPTDDEPLAGSRVKTTVSDPETEQLYIFKQPKSGREAQIWSELIASFIAGDLLGWPVQHVQIALRGDRVGNLLKYIYDHKDDAKFILGEQLCKHVDSEYDPKQGRRHTWDLIQKIKNKFFIYDADGKPYTYAPRSFDLYWVRTILFDTLISNSDRHAENWALTLGENAPNLMAPLYDNGSSMGCENTNLTLERKWFNSNGEIKRSKVESYADAGCHHLSDGNERYKFEDLASLILKELPDMRPEYEIIAQLDLEPVENLLDAIMSMNDLPEVAQLTPLRATQMMALLHQGQSRVRRCIQEKA